MKPQEFINLSSKIYITSHSLSCLIVPARISNSMLNRSNKIGQTCLIPDLRGKTFRFLPLTMEFAMGLTHMDFIMLWYIPSIHNVLRVIIMKGCWIFSKFFFTYLDVQMIYFVNAVFHIDWFAVVEPSCIPGINLLVHVYNPFNVALNSCCYDFVEDVYIFVH